MCGVLVHVRSGAGDPPVDAAGWGRAMGRLGRRGPDGRGEWVSPSGLARLGHTRLAINDLSAAGAQPMVLGRGDRGPLALVANGEVYNAPALRRELEAEGCRFMGRSDCEVVLHATGRWGFERAIESLRGMFAAVVWDDERGVLHGAVDHAGMKPLVYAEVGGGIVLGSDADAVVALLGRRPALDGVGIGHVLALGYCPGPRTVWEGVRKLGPGERLEWRPGGRACVSRWWAPARVATGPAGAGEQDEQFGAIWREVVREHLLSDVPVGVFLSGGLDSSAVAAGVVDAGGDGRDVRAYTLGLESADDESGAAAETARHLTIGHTVIPMGRGGVEAALGAYAECFDEPQGYGALLTAVTLARAAREHGRVMLSGDGGDEAFAGYTWHARPEWGGRPGQEGGMGATPPLSGSAPSALCVRGSREFALGHLRRVLPRWELWEVERLLEPLGAGYGEEEFAGWAAGHDEEGLEWPRRAQALDLMTFCAGSILPKVDRATMGVGLEVRAPFLDRRVLEWALSLPVSEGEGGGGGASKAVVRRYVAGRVPRGVLERPKQGFSLRLGPGAWDGLASRLGESRLIRDGIVHEHWRELVGGAQGAGKRQALVMLAAWWEGRG